MHQGHDRTIAACSGYLVLEDPGKPMSAQCTRQLVDRFGCEPGLQPFHGNGDLGLVAAGDQVGGFELGRHGPSLDGRPAVRIHAEW